MSPSRRALLGTAAGVTLASLAGCLGSLPAGGDEPDGGDDGSGGATTTDDGEDDGSGGATTTDDSEDDGAGGATTTGGAGAFEARLEGPEDDRLLFEGTDLDSVGTVEESRNGYFVPVVLTDDGEAAVTETFRAAGVADDNEAFEVVLSLDGEELERFGVAPSLAEAVTEDDWGGEMRLTFGSREEAEDVRDAVCSGDGPDCTAE